MKVRRIKVVEEEEMKVKRSGNEKEGEGDEVELLKREESKGGGMNEVK